MSVIITWNGHANFSIDYQGYTILIDPWFDGNPSACIEARECKNIDLVLITHDHQDHIGQAVSICCDLKAKVVANLETARKLAKENVPQDQIINGVGMNIGGTVEVDGIQVTMVQAFHSSATGSPVGYIITLPNGYTIYHAGDTGIFATMAIWGELYDIDLALLPIGGVFTMDPRQAALACKLLKCTSVIPMHWGSFPVLEQSTDHFARELKHKAPDCQLIALSPGESIELS